MFKFNWKVISLYFNFLGSGGSLEEVELAAQAYTEAVCSATPQPITSQQLEDPGIPVTTPIFPGTA